MIYLLILVTTFSNIGAQLLLKRGVGHLGSIARDNWMIFLVQAAISPWVWFALALQVFGYLIWIYIISQEKLGVAFALSASFFYLILAFLSWLLYDEHLTVVQWSGLFLISAGVIALARG